MTTEKPNPQKIIEHEESSLWGWTTKLVVGIALVAIFLLLIIKFQSFLGPLITALLIAFLLNPLANFLHQKIKIPWKISVTFIYILLILIVLGLTTWGGFALIEQIQNLIGFIENNIFYLPELVANITEQTYRIGPFSFSLSGINWDEITGEIVRAIQPALGRLGIVMSSIAAGAVSIITWTILIILISYFFLAESEGFPGKTFSSEQKESIKDFQRISSELIKIWRAFIRGELLVVLISYIIYVVLLGVLGVQFFAGLSAIAALGQLIPYIGAWATWVSFGLVSLFQTNIPFNLPGGIYVIIVLTLSMIANGIIDNIIRTKVMSSGLKVHPALVLISAIISVQLFGFIGIIIAAPMMASFILILKYVIKKLRDQDPWAEEDQFLLDVDPIKAIPFAERYQSFKNWVVEQWENLRGAISKNKGKQ